MSVPSPLKWMCCYVCGKRMRATIGQAKTHGWTVWVGGAICKACPMPTPETKP